MPDLLAHFLSRQITRTRIAIIIDATASRESTWDMAMKLQGEMFEQVAKLGGLEVQLIYYRGLSECSRSPWMSDGPSMAPLMSKVICRGGPTQIQRALGSVRQETQKQKVAALVFVGDAMEEEPGDLYDAAAALGAPLYMFQEGNDEICRPNILRNGTPDEGRALSFRPGADRQLSELLRAVAALAVGGVKAMESQNTAGAKLLLGRLNK
jgi:hypothetical protein